MEDVIKRLYARELELIADRPAAKKKESFLAFIRERLWNDKSFATKTAAVAFVLALMSAFVYYYNFLTIERFKVHLEKAQIEAELQRRNDLIPNLVKAVSDYMSFENQVFQHAADVRSALGSLKSIPNMSPSALSIQPSLSKFQAVAENYPDLKASGTYQNLMKELSNTETRIAEARIKYNAAANFYNSRLRMVPGGLFGFILGFGREKTFEADDAARTVPAVK